MCPKKSNSPTSFERRRSTYNRESKIIIIAAVAEKNRVIGKGKDLPWHIPEDLKRFKRLTTGYPLVMGRRTFESVLHQFGKPLPGRRNIILTSTGKWPEYREVETYTNLDELFSVLENESIIYIGGGATVYERFLPLADRLELTLVEGEYDGTVFFPAYEGLIGTDFYLAGEEKHEGFRFVTLDRL